MNLNWTSELSVGIELIDRQHQELFDRFNQLLDACNQRRGKEQLVELFHFLDRYVAQHFREEEALMEEHAYPELADHCRQHREFAERLADLKSELDKSGPTVAVLIHTNKTLLYWLTSHIKQVDTRLGAFLQKIPERSC